MIPTYAQLFRVLGHPHRLEILELLLAHEEALGSSFIAATLGKTPARTSGNLKPLADVGLVLKHKEGRKVFYVPNRELAEELGRSLGKEKS